MSTALPPTSHSGLDMLQVVLQSSFPVQAIMVLLVAASIVSWAIIFRKRVLIARAQREARLFEERFLAATELSELYDEATRERQQAGGMEAIFEAGFREFNLRRMRKSIDSRMHLENARRAMRAAGSREIDDLEHSLEVLANIGSTAPYVGLVGTVFGIMLTMHGLLSSETQAGIKDVAPGISEALLATAMGLFVAIPAVWAYNRFIHGVERLAARYDTFADEFSSLLQQQMHPDD
jgi:biopolymer transport protein TolQ